MYFLGQGVAEGLRGKDFHVRAEGEEQLHQFAVHDKVQAHVVVEGALGDGTSRGVLALTAQHAPRVAARSVAQATQNG